MGNVEKPDLEYVMTGARSKYHFTFQYLLLLFLSNSFFYLSLYNRHDSFKNNPPSIPPQPSSNPHNGLYILHLDPSPSTLETGLPG
jgi:hypothetical protein